MRLEEDMTHRSSSRFTELDGLRGIAALAVVLSHLVGMVQHVPLIARIDATYLHGCWDGASAVMLFFVLSGFVLARSLDGVSLGPGGVASFLVKRFFRLYPAYWGMLGIAALLQYSLFNGSATAIYSPWFHALWRTPISLRSFLWHLPMVSRFRTTDLDPVVWSLVIEMKASILFPALFATFRVAPGFRSRSAVLALWVSGCAVLAHAGIGIAYFLPFFALGIFVANESSRLCEWLGRCASNSSVVFFVAYGLYAARFGLGLETSFVADVLAAAGSALLILWAISFRGPRAFLSCVPLQVLGQASYGLYLIHLPLLLVVSSHVTGLPSPVVVSFVIVLPASVGIAYLVYRWVERPFIKLGSRVVKACFEPARTPPAVAPVSSPERDPPSDSAAAQLPN